MLGKRDEDKLSNALGDAAETIAGEIACCRESAEGCIKAAWGSGPEEPETRRALLERAEAFMRLSAELAAALAKLKGDGQVHRQHISVEHIETGAPAVLAGSATLASMPRTVTDDEGEGEGRIPENESL